MLNITGIICAMDKEVTELLPLIKYSETIHYGGFNFIHGMIHESEVVVCISGIGKVASAVCTQTMILKFHPTKIINIGVCGAVTSNIRVLDTIIATSVAQWDFDTSPTGDPLGKLPSVGSVLINTDAVLTTKLAYSCGECDCKHTRGTIASGDKFVASQDEKDFIYNNFHALGCDMESGSIGQACAMAKVPFAILRCVSDSYKNPVIDYSKFCDMAAKQAVKVLDFFFAVYAKH